LSDKPCLKVASMHCFALQSYDPVPTTTSQREPNQPSNQRL
jgi:hypothetical protein